MSFSPIEFNQILGQSSEVAKIKKKELDKKKLEKIQQEEDGIQKIIETQIEDVEDKDPEITLDKELFPETVKQKTVVPKKENNNKHRAILNESFKGNFLDIKE